jgi:hypothetical protein
MSDCAHCEELLARAEKSELEMEALRERIVELETQVLQEQIAGVKQVIKQIVASRNGCTACFTASGFLFITSLTIALPIRASVSSDTCLHLSYRTNRL